MTTNAQLEYQAGDILDEKYRIERLLGVGGMGAVYLARRIALGDRVAVKSVLSTQDTEVNRARFLREAQAAAAIRHPNVVQVFDFGQPAGCPPYMVMEYLDGPTLAAVLAGGAVEPSRGLALFAGICAAVEAGHRRGVVHRDIKPGNVILARSDDGRESVKVLDFGLARITGSEASALTSPGAMVGTCSYMAPELIESGQATVASDVFALGVLLYELVTGRSPFKAATNPATIMRIASGQYEPPKTLLPDLPAPLCAGIEAALAHDPMDRPVSPEQLAALVGAPLGASASDGGSGEWPRLREVSGVGAPGELEPSMVSTPGVPEVGEVTLSDEGPTTHGTEQTLVGDVAAPGGPPIVGREDEVEALRREFRSVLGGRGRLVVITGDAGVGKTTLLDAFGQWLASQRAVMLRGRFFSYEGDRPPPYETFLWMLSHSRSGSPAHAIAGQNRPGGSGGIDTSQDKWQVFAALTAAFAETARGRPLVVGLDDLQWASALDLEFLSHLPHAASRAAVMVVGTARESDSDTAAELSRWMARLGSQRSLKTVEVGRFGTADVRAWFQANFPGIRIRPQDLRRLQHATSGNPYYLNEVVRRLVEAGQITRDATGLACESLDDVVLPETVGSVVRGKLEGLSEALRLVLEMACVIGEEFRFETLLSALGAQEDELEAVLDEAVRRRLLSEEGLTPGSDYRFESTALRSVLYGQLSKRRRRRLHRGVVEAMGKLYGDRDAGRIAKVLAYHYHAVEDHAQTLRWGVRAAVECLRRHDSDHAETALRRARRAVASLEEAGEAVPRRELADLDRWTGALYNVIGRFEEAEALLRRALEARDDTHDPSWRLDVLLDLAESQLGRGEFERGLATGREAIDAAREQGDTAREHAARVVAARCAAPRGLLDQAQALLEPAAAADPDPGGPALSIPALASAELGWVFAKRGDFQRAEGSAKLGHKLARKAGDLLAEYRSLSVLGLTYLEGGDQVRSLHYLGQALDLARRLSLRRREAIELHNIAEALYFQRKYEDAIERAHQALAIVLEIRDRGTEGDCRVNIGRMLMAKGDRPAARTMLEQGLALASHSGRSEYEGLALVALADQDLEAGDPDSAADRLGRAHALFAEIGSLYRWRAELGLARVATATGDVRTAMTRATEAAGLLEGMRERLAATMDTAGVTAALAEVHRVLDELEE